MTGMFLRYSLFCFFLYAGSAIMAQKPVFRNYPLKQLDKWRINTMFQDRSGMIWLGAKEGLAHFDGQSYHTIPLPDSLSTSEVTAIGETEGLLWVGFKNGQIARLRQTEYAVRKAKISPHTGSPLQIWQIEEGLPRKAITAILPDPNGLVWIATYGEGLYAWNGARLYLFDVADEGIAGNEIYKAALDQKNRVWLATDNGVSICSLSPDNRKNIKNFGVQDGLPDEIITDLHADSDGNIWLAAYDRGLAHYDVQGERFDFSRHDLQFGRVTAMMSWGREDLWVSIAEKGLRHFHFRRHAGNLIPDAEPSETNSENYDFILKDREGLLWLVLPGQALQSANVRFLQQKLPGIAVQAVLADQQNRLWIGAQDGLYKISKNGEWQCVMPRENVISLWKCPLGRIWAGTFGQGVIVADTTGKVIKRITEKNGLANGSVLSISGSGRRAWLATLGGVTEINDVEFITGVKTLQLPHPGYVYQIITDRKGRVWFATDGQGLCRLDGDQFQQWMQINDTPIRTVYCMTEDEAGNIWFSGENQGLFEYRNDGSFFHWTTREGLHSHNIVGLSVGNPGEMVIAYENGLDLFQPSRRHFLFMSDESGIPIVQTALNALSRGADGRLWIGAKEGLLTLTPAREAFQIDPQISITGISVYLQGIDFARNTSLAYHQNYLTFFFNGLWLTQPEAVRYRYKLDGFDAYWNETLDRLAAYPNLPPGRYTFRVQASEHGNFEHVPEAVWAFEIRPPFWKKWWFITSLIALSGGLIYAFIRSREQRLRREAHLRRKHLEAQFEALKSQINPHFLFNSFNTLTAVIEENPKSAVEYVEHLSDFYRKIMVYRERDFIPVEEEIELVKNYAFLLQKRFQGGFQLNINADAALHRQIMPFTLQMLVENAVKHNIVSSTRPLLIEISAQINGSNDVIVVRNNLQPKIKPEPGSKFGLQSLIKRYDMLGGPPVVAGPKMIISWWKCRWEFENVGI